MDIPLDQNFPVPILESFKDFIPEVRFLPIRQIHESLPSLDDRKLIIALHQRKYRALITNNYKMLQNPSELAAILKTKISVVALEGVGHDPIRAAGALLLDLPSIVKALEDESRGTFWLRPRNPRPRDAWDLFKVAARNRNENVNALYEQVKVSDGELARLVD